MKFGIYFYFVIGFVILENYTFATISSDSTARLKAKGKILYKWKSTLSQQDSHEPDLLGFISDFREEELIIDRTTEVEEDIKKIHNDPKRCYEIGLEYLEGDQYMAPKPDVAKIWFERAAAKGHILARDKLQTLDNQ